MPWPQQRRLLGTKSRGWTVRKIDRPRPLHLRHQPPRHAARQDLRCPYATPASATSTPGRRPEGPGFRAIQNIAAANAELFFAGAEILAVACDTEEHCDDAIHAIAWTSTAALPGHRGRGLRHAANAGRPPRTARNRRCQRSTAGMRTPRPPPASTTTSSRPHGPRRATTAFRSSATSAWNRTASSASGTRSRKT